MGPWPGRSAAASPEPPASLSTGLFGRATVPLPAPWSYKLSHTQFWLPARLAPYQLESQLPRSDTDEEEVDPSQVPSRPNLSEKLIISVPGIFVIPFRPIF